MTANLEGLSLSRFLLNENWTTKKCSDYVYDTGFEEGKNKGILMGYVNCMRSLMKGKNLSFDDAANELNISAVDRPALREAMEQ